MRRTVASLFMITLLVAVIGATAAAQTSVIPGKTPPQDPAVSATWEKLKSDERRALLSRLSDTQVREIIISQLDRAAKAESAAREDSSMISGFEARAHLIRENLGKLLVKTGQIPSAFSFAHAKLTEGKSPWHVLLVFVGMSVMFAVGWLAERMFRRWAEPRQSQLEQSPTLQFRGKVGLLGLRLVLDLAAVTVFSVAAIATFFVLYQGHGPSRLLVTAGFSTVLVIKMTSVVTRFLLSPDSAHLRLIALNDTEANYYHHCALWFAGIAAFGVLTCSLMQLLGLTQDLHLLMRLIVGIVLTTVLCLMIWHGRKGIANLIRGSTIDGVTASRGTVIFSEAWHYLAIAYVLGVAGLAFIRILAGEPAGAAVSLGSLLVVIVVPLLDAAIGRLLEDFSSARQVDGDPDKESSYIPAIRKGVRILLVLLGIIVFVRFWGVDLFSMADHSLGATVTRAILDVGFTVLIAYVGWQIVKTAIDRHLASQDGGAAVVERGSEGGGAGTSRLGTLLPLIRRFLQILITVMVVMIILSSLGVDIGPLIAGAGIFGIAVGFGAQTLVRDIVSGIFFPNKRGEFMSHVNFVKREWYALFDKMEATHQQNPENAPSPSERFNWHALRHFAVSTWIEAKLSPKTVQTFAGHSSLQVTMDRYGHLFKSDDHKRAMDQIADIMYEPY